MKNIHKIFFLCILASAIFLQEAQAFKIGIISDIHAGKETFRRKSEYNKSNTIQSRKYAPQLRSVLNQMSLQGVGTAVTTGDNTANDSPSYAVKIKKIVKKSGMDVLWGKGNHEGKKTLRYFVGRGNYYFEDKDGWRMIFLDTNEASTKSNNSQGGIGSIQLDWLRSRVEEFNGSILVLMHHPIWRIRDNLPDEIYPDYTELEKIFSESGKVKYVIAGHVHINYQFSKNFNGVQYYVNSPLTLKSRLGSYQILDLP